MDLNLLIFILMVAFGVGILEPSTLALLKWGADFGPLTLDVYKRQRLLHSIIFPTKANIIKV